MKIESNDIALMPLDKSLQLLRTPEPPYIAVISTNIQNIYNKDMYDKAMQKMLSLAKDFPGFLGVEIASDTLDDGRVFKLGIVYWRDMLSLHRWRQDQRHMKVKQKGKADWYDEHNIRICEVQMHYGANLTQGQSSELAYPNEESDKNKKEKPLHELELSELKPELIFQVRNDKTDLFDHALVVTQAKSSRSICRCCLNRLTKGEEVILLSFSPFKDNVVYQEIGPIYIHATYCDPYKNNFIPNSLYELPVIIKGYDNHDVLVAVDYNQNDSYDKRIDKLYHNQNIKHIHFRDAEFGCYLAGFKFK